MRLNPFIRRDCTVMSVGLRQLGCTILFNTSDSSPVGLSLLGRGNSDRTGTNRQNTYWVDEAGLMDQASSLPKADGARSVTPKRSRWFACDYFREGRGVSCE